MKTLILIASIFIFSLASYGQCKEVNKSAFTRLPAKEKVQLWRTHIEKQLRERKLNEDQRGVIFAALLLLNEDLYTKPNPKAFEPIKKQFRVHFSLKEASEIFEQLSNWIETDPVPVGDCSCSTTWTFCDVGGCEADASCTKVINCGPFWAFQCNGHCRTRGEDLK